jgi:hypothetical protein
MGWLLPIQTLHPGDQGYVREVERDALFPISASLFEWRGTQPTASPLSSSTKNFDARKPQESAPNFAKQVGMIVVVGVAAKFSP